MKIHTSLIVKLTFATSVILLLFMWVLDSVNLKNFRNVMIGYAVSSAEQVADVIGQSAFDAMLHNDKASLYNMIGRIAASEHIEHIRLIDKKGMVVFSNVSGETGSVIGKHAAECAICHDTGERGALTSTREQSRLITARDGGEALGFTKAIYNQPACSAAACHFHGSGDTVLGVLDISISLDQLHRQSRQYRLQFVMLTCMLLLVIGGLLTALIRFLIDLPVRRLVDHSMQVAKGNLAARVRITSNDELGELSVSMNAMTESLGRAEHELKEWGEQLEEKVAERSREISRMGEQLRRSEKMAALGTLAAGVAHEINNPLTGIMLYASLVSGDSRLDPELQPDLQRIIAETDRCAGIVKGLLEFSRESVPVRSDIDLGALLEETVLLFHKQPEFRAIEIISRLDPALPPIAVDPSQIRQVFMNLIINAGHAMPGGGRLELVTGRTDDGRSLRVVIRDSGCGIPEAVLPRLFEPFFTTKADGTGLGLAISYGIIENHGGTIKVSSREGEGTEVVVTLPLMAD